MESFKENTKTEKTEFKRKMSDEELFAIASRNTLNPIVMDSARYVAELWKKANMVTSEVGQAQVELCVLKGIALGFDPVTAAQHVVMVKGRITVEALGKHGLVVKKYPDAIFEFTKSTEDEAELYIDFRGKRHGPYTSMKKNLSQGQLKMDTWKNNPWWMHRKKCIGKACDEVFPDVVMGLSTKEDMDEVAFEDAARDLMNNAANDVGQRSIKLSESLPKPSPLPMPPETPDLDFDLDLPPPSDNIPDDEIEKAADEILEEPKKALKEIQIPPPPSEEVEKTVKTRIAFPEDELELPNIEEKLCVGCGMFPRYDGEYCEQCSDIPKEYRDTYIDSGVCMTCGKQKNNISGGTGSCLDCDAKPSIPSKIITRPRLDIEGAKEEGLKTPKLTNKKSSKKSVKKSKAKKTTKAMVKEEKKEKLSTQNVIDLCRTMNWFDSSTSAADMESDKPFLALRKIIFNEYTSLTTTFGKAFQARLSKKQPNETLMECLYNSTADYMIKNDGFESPAYLLEEFVKVIGK